jgi:hypothetical protein
MKIPKFRERVMQIVDQEVIVKFDKRQVSASEFYEPVLSQDETVIDGV